MRAIARLQFSAKIHESELTQRFANKRLLIPVDKSNDGDPLITLQEREICLRSPWTDGSAEESRRADKYLHWHRTTSGTCACVRASAWLNCERGTETEDASVSSGCDARRGESFARTSSNYLGRVLLRSWTLVYYLNCRRDLRQMWYAQSFI